MPEAERFSQQKTLYDYQRSALENAARALCLYYKKGTSHYQLGEGPNANEQRKADFAGRYYSDIDGFSIPRFESKADRRNQRQNPVFRILSEFIAPQGEEIPYRRIINRMCFWMATGSGKTLVMIKLIEYLHCLQQHEEIPSRNILVLAPSEHLLGQIRRSIEEFNQTGLFIDFVPLREIHRVRQGRLGTSGVITVYYHRSDNVSDAQKEALIDYRRYENDGKWYILLDEAHKGGKEDSKRQAYYAVMAREGFLFNFSATFADKEDIVTTVKEYNLQKFIEGGRGKNIYLNEEEYTAFKDRIDEVNRSEREKIVLKSLLTFACVSRRVFELREKTNIRELYHLPLMLTLVNSVNTNVEKERNDLWAFFQILRGMASGEMDMELFEESKGSLIEDWRNGGFIFGESGAKHLGKNESFLRQMTVADVRKAIFLSRKKGALQLIRSRDNKELAFQLKNADSPFALIRIGDTSKWRRELLAGYEETAAMQETSYFDGLEQSSITLLMGSRSFFESWDSNRPNVINYINIGGSDAKKFVVQSIGRGVRIETLPGKRRRYSFLFNNGNEKAKIGQLHDDEVILPETLFLFATNRNAVKAVLEGLWTEKSAVFEKLDGIKRAPVPTIDGEEMPLLIPKYREAEKDLDQSKFTMSKRTRQRFLRWLDGTSDAVFMVRNGFDKERLAALQSVIKDKKKYKIQPEKDYARLPFLQERLLSYLSKMGKATDGVRALEDQDVVHFREIRVLSKHFDEIQRKIDEAKQEPLSYQEIGEMAWRLEEGEIGRDEFAQRVSGRDEVKFEDLIIKKIVGHYYFPIILGNERADYIRHIIKVPSEVEFLNLLENWLKGRRLSWDAWMFTKINEFWDKHIYIPYYDGEMNDYRRFLPDFVFWMCKGNEYHIVFVDPKGTVHDSAYHKIDGYRNLFEENGKLKQFKYRGLNVRVQLWMFNKNSENVPEQYRRFYIDSPERIFDPR